MENFLTPSSLGEAPVKIKIDSGNYDYESDKRVYADGKDPLQFTYAGTQTFDFSGKPYDSDND